MAHDGQQGRVLGRYVLCGELASGGMATVHLARHLGPHGFCRSVAVKRLHEGHAKDPDFVAMFLDEARLASRIHHPNVASIIDVISTPSDLCLVMDYLHGESLAQLQRRAEGKPIEVPIAAAIVVDALRGLHAAHEVTDMDGTKLELVHRDVSPQNLFVGADGVTRVLDFGIAKASSRSQVTRDGQVKGKLAYMAPEQIRSEPADRRVDVFATGVVLW
ncbi:MAG: serine/threonine-protein kinase [Polyangiaceae bacterium]